jgi:hypothetical protein
VTIQKAGVPSIQEVKRAKSRLKILPNPMPDDILNRDIDPEKAVESPWQVVPKPTVNPSAWDRAELTIIAFEDLYATDPWLTRKTVKEHIESMGGATTPYRSYALVYEQDDKPIIIDGHHRLTALWLLGLESAPVWLVKEK